MEGLHCKYTKDGELGAIEGNHFALDNDKTRHIENKIPIGLHKVFNLTCNTRTSLITQEKQNIKRNQFGSGKHNVRNKISVCMAL